MRDSIYRFSLDIHSTQSQVSISVPQFDTARSFYATLTESGKPYQISPECRAVFCATKADGTKLFNDCIIISNSIVRYDFTEQTTTSVGIVDCSIKIYGSNNKVLTSPRLTIVVYEGTGDEAWISDNESSVIGGIVQAEVGRVDAEALRVEAETERVEAETERVEAETERVEAENARKKALVDNLTTDDPSKYLSARMGKKLNDTKAPAGYAEEYTAASAAGEMDEWLVTVFDSMSLRSKKVVYVSHNVDESNTIGVPGGNWFFSLYKFASDYGVIEGVRYDFNASQPPLRITKNRAYGNWGEWMWVNPPAQVGVEYRTTERWQGMPVYTKLINLGTLPNNTSAYFYNTVPTNARVLSFDGYCSDNGGESALMKHISKIWHPKNQNYIGLSTNSNQSAYVEAYVVVKYTKE
jgi:hypothetical protein